MVVCESSITLLMCPQVIAILTVGQETHQVVGAGVSLSKWSTPSNGPLLRVHSFTRLLPSPFAE